MNLTTIYKRVLLEQILVEVSKNDPIPEITRMKDHLAIIVVGPPASGKSTFVNNFIMPRNPDIKSFNPDDVYSLITGDPTRSKNIPGVDDVGLTSKYLESYIRSGKNFVYDSTGNTVPRIQGIINLARENNYIVIICHLFAPKHIGSARNQQRIRHVDEDYLEIVYKTNQKIISKIYSESKPDNYYIVLSFENKYKFYKYEGGRLAKRKVDKYV